MTGVEILAVEEVSIVTKFNWPMCLLVFCVFALILVVVGFVVSFAEDDWSHLSYCCVLGILFGCLGGVLTGFEESIPTEYETKYKVTITDEVSMNEFLERYEIVDQDGKIYIVRERKVK